MFYSACQLGQVYPIGFMDAVHRDCSPAPTSAVSADSHSTGWIDQPPHALSLPHDFRSGGIACRDCVVVFCSVHSCGLSKLVRCTCRATRSRDSQSWAGILGGKIVLESVGWNAFKLTVFSEPALQVRVSGFLI
jgi:hypothetical protein